MDNTAPPLHHSEDEALASEGCDCVFTAPEKSVPCPKHDPFESTRAPQQSSPSTPEPSLCCNKEHLWLLPLDSLEEQT